MSNAHALITPACSVAVAAIAAQQKPVPSQPPLAHQQPTRLAPLVRIRLGGAFRLTRA